MFLMKVFVEMKTKKRKKNSPNKNGRLRYYYCGDEAVGCKVRICREKPF